MMFQPEVVSSVGLEVAASSILLLVRTLENSGTWRPVPRIARCLRGLVIARHWDRRATIIEGYVAGQHPRQISQIRR
jgi:hypothetical protein